MPSFEEWRGSYTRKATPDEDMQSAYEAGQSAATFAANSKLGDEGNEGAKDARRKVAVKEATDWLGGKCLDAPLTFREMLYSVIKKAQG